MPVFFGLAGQQAAEARGFVSNFERLLVAVDRSASGHLASRLAGLLAGVRRIPTTVLPVENGLEERRKLVYTLNGEGRETEPPP